MRDSAYLKMHDLAYLINNKYYHLIVRVKQFKRYASVHLYFSSKKGFSRALDKFSESSAEWEAAEYCKRMIEADISPFNASIEITSANAVHFQLQLANILAWVNVQDDILADVLISQESEP